MNIFGVISLGLIGAVLALTIKSTRPEMAILVSLTTGIAIITVVAKDIIGVFKEINNIINQSGVNAKYFEIAVKASVIAYITQFASEMCKDAGEGAVAVKIEFAGKLSILVLSIPVISAFLNSISALLDRI